MEKVDLTELQSNPLIQRLGEDVVNSKLVKGIAIEDQKKEIEKESKKIVRELEEIYKTLLNEFREEFSLIKTEVAHILSDREFETFEEEFVRAGALVQKKAEIISEFGMHEEVLQESLEISKNSMFVMYEVGNNFFTKGEFEEAKKVFNITTALNPLIYEFWIALGSTELQLGNHEQALNDFAFATVLDYERPESHYYLSISYLELGDLEEAEKECRELKKVVDGSGLLSDWDESIKELNKLF